MWQLGPAWRDEPALAAAWRAAEPFPHLVIDDFQPGGTLARILELLDDEHVDRYEADLFAFEATAPEPASEGLRALRDDFARMLGPPLSRITGTPVARADMRAYAYRPGHYLLPHSDHQDGLDRRLAYACYLPSPELPAGGELELYRVAPDAITSAKLVAPRANRIAFFDVSDRSLHQVREVTAGLRLSLAGWFYP